MKNITSIFLFFTLTLTCLFADTKGETPISDKLKTLWADPVLQEKIAIGIEHNRKGDFYLNFVDEKNKPVKVENLKIM